MTENGLRPLATTGVLLLASVDAAWQWIEHFEPMSSSTHEVKSHRATFPSVAIVRTTCLKLSVFMRHFQDAMLMKGIFPNKSQLTARCIKTKYPVKNRNKNQPYYKTNCYFFGTHEFLGGNLHFLGILPNVRLW